MPESSLLQGVSLAGRTALVTGASRGIGRAVAGVLAGAGVTVHLLARGPADLQSAADAIGQATIAHRCDITNAGDVARVADAVRAACDGAPDILVNNAGLFPLESLDTMRVETLEATIAVNLIAPFRVLREFLPAMRGRGSGHVVTIGSVADRAVFAGNGAYSASKFGQRAMHEALRTELRGTGVRATLISPSATDTPIWDPINPDEREGFPSRASMLRPRDVADAVLWAVTRAASVNVDELRLSSS